MGATRRGFKPRALEDVSSAAFLPDLESDILREPAPARLALITALAELAMGEWAGAAAALAEALRLRPRSVPAAGLAALDLMLRGLADQARPSIDAAVRRSGARAWPYVLRALDSRRRGLLEAARGDLDEALRRRRDAAALELRAEVLSDLGFVREAIRDLGSALRLTGPDVRLILRRAEFKLNRREYPGARADLDRALALSPRDRAVIERRAEYFTLVSRPTDAGRELDRALRLSGGDPRLRLARLDVLIQRGKDGAARRELRRLERSADPDVRRRSFFYRGVLNLRCARCAAAERDFKRAAHGAPPGDAFARKALFYRIVARTAGPAFRRRHGLAPAQVRRPKLFLCGLGLFAPYGATLEVLDALRRCDVLFNNVAGPEVRELLGALGAKVRPATYDARRDEARWSGEMFRELGAGKAVGFVTRGHPLVFGGLARDLVVRGRRRGIPVETFAAVSSLDVLPARMAELAGCGATGLELIDRNALDSALSLDRRLPLVCSFYDGLRGLAVRAFARSLGRFYRPSRPCWMFGPKYEETPSALRLGDLPKRYPDIHASMMLYVPGAGAAAARSPKAAARRRTGLTVCGLGAHPPDTASIDVLHALASCDAVFSACGSAALTRFLREFCPKVIAAKDERAGARPVLNALARGQRVAWVAPGLPVRQGPAGEELIRRCLAGGVRVSVLGAATEVDALLARTGIALGHDVQGVRVVDARSAARGPATASPLLICFDRPLGQGELRSLARALSRRYGARGHGWLFGAGRACEPVQVELGRLDRGANTPAAGHTLYVPAGSSAR